MNRKVLVTGGRGFIGSFLVETLLDQGFEVRCLLRNSGKGLSWLKNLPIEISYGDLTHPVTLSKAVEGVEYVFHLAGLTKAMHYKQYYQANVEGTRNLLQACMEQNTGIKRFVYVSSLAAAGPSRDGKPLTENDPPHPISDYGRSKLQGEEITMHCKNHFPVTIIRPPVVFGPRDRDVLNFFKMAKWGVCPVLSGGERLSSVIFVKDLVEGMVLAATHPDATAQIFYLSNEHPYSWDKFSRLIGEVLQKKIRKIVVPIFAVFKLALISHLYARFTHRTTLFNLDKYREIKQKYWLCDSTKARRIFGFQIKFELRQAIQETLQWYEENGWL